MQEWAADIQSYASETLLAGMQRIEEFCAERSGSIISGTVSRIVAVFQRSICVPESQNGVTRQKLSEKHLDEWTCRNRAVSAACSDRDMPDVLEALVLRPKKRQQQSHGYVLSNCNGMVDVSDGDMVQVFARPVHVTEVGWVAQTADDVCFDVLRQVNELRHGVGGLVCWIRSVIRIAPERQMVVGVKGGDEEKRKGKSERGDVVRTTSAYSASMAR